MPHRLDEDLTDLFAPGTEVAPRTHVPVRPAVPAVERISLSGTALDSGCAEAYCDGGCRGNPGPAAYGVLIRHEAQTTGLKGMLPHTATNNEAEYASLMVALRWAVQHRVRKLLVSMDSELVVRQMQGRYGVGPKLRPLYLDACRLVLQIGDVTFRHIYREQNSEADRLANAAMDEAGIPRETRYYAHPRRRPPTHR